MIKHLLIVLSIAFQEQLAISELCARGVSPSLTLIYALIGSTLGYLVFWYFRKIRFLGIGLLRFSGDGNWLSSKRNRFDPWSYWWQTLVIHLVIIDVNPIRFIQITLLTLGILGFWLHGYTVEIWRNHIHDKIKGHRFPILSFFGIACIPIPVTLQIGVAGVQLLKIENGFWWILVASFIRTYIAIVLIHQGVKLCGVEFLP